MSRSSLWQAEEVVRLVRGRCLHEQSWSAGGVSIESQSTAPGDLFVAFQDAEHDGHEEVAIAFSKGAAAALVSRQPKQTPPDASLIFVDDTFSALQNLAWRGRARARGKIIAVTGSAGKTSTKEMLRLSLGAVGRFYANPDAIDYQRDILLALANLPLEADYSIFEMNAKKAGEIAALSLLVRPHVAVVTTVEPALLEYFGSIEALADAYAEIFQGMNEKGVAVLNSGNPHFARLAAAAKNRGIKDILSFSDEEKADAWARRFYLAEDGSAVRAVIGGRDISYLVGAPGQHLVRDSLAALLTSVTVSGKIEECATALLHYVPSPKRGGTQTIELEGGGYLTLIDESLDANPTCIRGAIHVLALSIPEQGGRRLLVLGDMTHLGITAPDLHMGLAPDIRLGGISLIFCCGENMRYLYDALPEALRGAYATDYAELAAQVAQTVRAGDIVTVSGSDNAKLNLVIDALKNLGTLSQQQVVNA